MPSTGLHSAVKSKSRKFEPQLGHITFVEIDHQMISTLSLLPYPLIHEGQLSDTHESMRTSTD